MAGSMDGVTKTKYHAVLDLHSRRRKALKIERLLDLSERREPLKLIEIGTGSGGIAHYFARHSTLRFDVTAVDVVDLRVVRGGFEFKLVQGTKLPFSDAFFDVVLSNHVIEHVGRTRDQRDHLREMYRVMKPEGIGYLATPNRWMFIEPHYRLPFLSWLPRSMRHDYVRAMKKGDYYDCEPLSLWTLERHLKDAGFHYENLALPALHETLRMEMGYEFLAQAAGKIPRWLFRSLHLLVPTLVYRLKKG